MQPETHMQSWKPSRRAILAGAALFGAEGAVRAAPKPQPADAITDAFDDFIVSRDGRLVIGAFVTEPHRHSLTVIHLPTLRHYWIHPSAPHRRLCSPKLAHDGKRLAFVECDHPFEENTTIFVSDLHGNKRQAITGPGEFRTALAFSPDDRKLCFAEGPGPLVLQLIEQTLATGERHRFDHRWYWGASNIDYMDNGNMLSGDVLNPEALGERYYYGDPTSLDHRYHYPRDFIIDRDGHDKYPRPIVPPLDGMNMTQYCDSPNDGRFLIKTNLSLRSTAIRNSASGHEYVFIWDKKGLEPILLSNDRTKIGWPCYRFQTARCSADARVVAISTWDTFDQPNPLSYSKKVLLVRNGHQAPFRAIDITQLLLAGDRA